MMNKVMSILSTIAVAGLAASITLAAAPGGPPAGGPGGPGGPGGRGGFGGGGGFGCGRGGGGGRGNGGDVAPSTNPSAKSLSPVTTPSTQPDASVFITRWSILEPISGVNGSGQNTLHPNALKEYFPNQMTVIPKDGDTVSVNGQDLKWHQLDTRNFNVNLVHFANDLGINSANGAMFWVVTVINVPEEMKDVRLAIGSNDGSVWWVNGQEACGIYGDILTFPDDAVSKRLTLKKGANIIRGVIHNDRGQTDFCVRVLGADDKPVTNYTITLNNPNQ